MRLAYRYPSASPGRHEDAEDVALSAFASFVRAVDAGRLPALNDRNNLWAILLTLTSRKAIKLVKHRSAKKRTPARSSFSRSWSGPAAPILPTMDLTCLPINPTPPRPSP